MKQDVHIITRLVSAFDERKYPVCLEFRSDSEQHRCCSRQVVLHNAHPLNGSSRLGRGGKDMAFAHMLHPPMKWKQRATCSVLRFTFLCTLILTHLCPGRSWCLCRARVPLRSHGPVGPCSRQSIAELPSIIQHVFSIKEKLPL